jgi:peptidoglycan/xylan/chitin deacetylase (PgdA/CDA1 family)
MIAGLGVGCAASLAYAYLAPRSRAFLPMVGRADGSRPAVALTFDDGPRPEGTGPILDLLAEHRVPAAFFVIGANAREHPDLVRQMHEQGHLVCNHTYDHRRFGALRSRRFWRNQLERTDEAIADAIGLTPALFRPPWGHKSPWMRAPLRELGKTPVGWSRRAFDGLPIRPGSIVRRMAPWTRAGDILVLHDGCEPLSSRDPAATVAALGPLIKAIRAKGLEFVRLDELLGINPYLATRTSPPVAVAV